MLCCCFTWIAFFELNFTAVFLLIKKIGMTDLLVRWGRMRDFKKWEDPSNGGDDFEMGV